MSGKELHYRYSEAFKQKVVVEIESGLHSISDSSKLYGVSTKSIRKWLCQLGKNHLIGKVVREEMRGEADRLKQLEKENQELESALAQAHLKILALESTIESVEEMYQVDFKKNFGTQTLKGILKK